MHTAGETKGIVDNKLVLTVFLVAILVMIVYPMVCNGDEEKLPPPTTNNNSTTTTDEFPKSGAGYLPQKIYLNKQRTHTRPSGRVKYTFADNPSIWIIENGPAKGNSGIDEKKLLSMPDGNYIATGKDVYMSWWQD